MFFTENHSIIRAKQQKSMLKIWFSKLRFDMMRWDVLSILEPTNDWTSNQTLEFIIGNTLTVLTREIAWFVKQRMLCCPIDYLSYCHCVCLTSQDFLLSFLVSGYNRLDAAIVYNQFQSSHKRRPDS